MDRAAGSAIARLLARYAEIEKGLVRPPALDASVDGYSGEKVLSLISETVRLKAGAGGCYAEIGVFRGMTLLATASTNRSTTCVGIDNYLFFDPKNENKKVVEERAKSMNLDNIVLIDKDFEDALDNFEKHVPKKIDVLFIDGPHDYRSQLLCLGLAVRLLAPGGVMIVDDCNYEHVRRATNDFVRLFPAFKLVFEAYTPCHPGNMTPAQIADARKGWWDGIHVVAHDPDDEVECFLAPVHEDRSQYFNDHNVHSLGFREAAVASAAFLHALKRPSRLPHATGRFFKALPKAWRASRGRFEAMNTWSDAIVGTRLAGRKDKR